MWQARFPRVLLTALLLGLALQAHAQVSISVLDGSRIWIDGSSNVNTFTCQTGEVDGYGRVATTTPLARVAALGMRADQAEAALVVPVQTFDCGKRQMNQDLYDALQVQEHPAIRFELNHAEVETPADTPDGRYAVRTKGRLTIAGTTRPVTLYLQVEPTSQGRYRARGSLPLLMTDFGVKPPTALLGLVQAHDRIVVRFDLITTADYPSAYNSPPGR